ncbi:MAG: hypothetical protein HY659_12165 [Rhizobiales bacterium]|nr:hypothetical protein [Hyphomicrobiales bacterium]
MILTILVIAVLTTAGLVAWVYWCNPHAFADLRAKFKGWRTVVFGSSIAIGSVTAELLDAFKQIDIAPLLPPAYALKIIAGIGVATILLRIVTTGRVGAKK